MTSDIASKSTAADDAVMDALIRRVMWRVIPLLTICWIVNWIDRINIGFARLDFQKTLNITPGDFGLIVGVYAIGYLLMEVPSNLLMQRIGVRKTMARILLIWGLITMLTAFAHTVPQFVVARFLLGVAEAGLFPGALLYLTYWFPARYRARVTSRFLIANAVAGIIGGPISGWILKNMTGIAGLHGWQWLFILEGLPPILLAVLVWFFLTEEPRQAHWLTSSEKETIERVLRADPQTSHHGGFLRALTDYRVYLLGITFCCTMICTGNVVQIWAPSIMKDAGEASIYRVGWMTAIPWAVGVVVMLAVSWSSDRMRERRWHFVAMGLIVAASMLALPALSHSVPLALLGLSVMTGAYLAATAVFWTIASLYLSPAARAGGLALVNTLGQFGGLFTPLLLGWSKAHTGSYQSALLIIGGVVLIGVIAVATAFRPAMPIAQRTKVA